MAIWKEQTPVKKDPTPMAFESAPKKEEARVDLPSTNFDPTRRPVATDSRESLIAPEITIEGKIEGAGHIRIAGRFKGDVSVQGNLAIESGAKVTGAVRASTVTVGGELEGNIDNAAKVELLATGVLIGDLKAGSLTVVAGSKMRGHAEFGWDGKAGPGGPSKTENGSTP